MTTRASISAQADANLLKDITKLVHRIERILVPINSLVHSTIGQKLDTLLAKAKSGTFFEDVHRFPHNDLIGYEVRTIEPLFRKVAWPKFEAAILNTVSDGDADYQLPLTVLNDIAMEKHAHEERLEKAANKERVRRLQKRNGLPVISGKWRKEPYAARSYEYLTDYAVTANVGEEEGKQLRQQLVTPLNGFLGQAYNYDDHDLTEEWMVTFQDKGSKGPSDDDVIRTQLESLLEIMMVAVQDRVCTETGVLQRAPLQLGVDIKEVPVWGIDCYTRRMVEMAIEDRVDSERRDAKSIKKFIERALLPTINDQPSDKAHDMTNTVNAILQNPQSSALNRLYAEAVHAAIQEYTIDVFRIHPKGTGVICINPAGIQPHVFLTSYLGELYPPYRWCERLDVVEQAQETFELKPTLPDFWNILLERPRQDPNGYGLLYVDASRKANNASSCSHSCDSNCTSAVVARNGKLAIALTTNRYVHYGEELTMDYYSITTSDIEWRAAICLCGSPECRGSFLHYATQDDLQQVLNQSCGPLWRYASLLRASSERPLAAEDTAVLVRHGMQSAALGPSPPTWVKKYAVDNLRFVEFERKALPQALMRSKDGSKSLYTFSAADMDARSVMEQRLQSMVCCFSMIDQVITHSAGKVKEKDDQKGSTAPLVPYFPAEAVQRVWEKLLRLPTLLQEHLLAPAQAAVKAAQAAVRRDKEKEIAKSTSFTLYPSASDVLSTHDHNSSSASTTGSTTGSAVSEAEKALPQKRGVVGQITTAMAEVATLLEAEAPKGLTKLREVCLALRTILKTIEHTSTARARIGQLCDVLIFWAYTTNFSTVQMFEAVESGPIEVYARELGNNIPRNKVFKNYRGGEFSLRSRDKAADPLLELPAVVPICCKGKQMPSEAAVGLEVAATTTAATDATAMDVTHDADGTTEHMPVAMPLESDTTSSEASSEMSVVDNENSVVECTEASEMSSGEAHQNQQPAHLQLGATLHTSKDYFLASDETVFVGTKKYSELFTFWQLMGWFNAGTDQKIEAPDLFGCVELPEPANCFGSAEVLYGAKQREALIALLRNDKSQTMSWPALLKQSFTPLTPGADSPQAPLYGSPMLDGALGQVGVVSKVIAALLEGQDGGKGSDGKKKGTAGSSKSASGDKDQVAQFDSILPPEMPTSWVQCELCRKWRRVAWFVNSDALPELWECHMNTWDLDNATCAAPQDGYDPDAENTLGFGTSEVAVSPENFVPGKKFDLYCTRNLVYYEAVVIKLKTNPKKPQSVPKVQFRFIGWGPRYDEDVPIDSDRISPHNLHTNPVCRNPREQERWQGRKDLYTALNPSDTKKPAAASAAAAAGSSTSAKGKGKGGKAAQKEAPAVETSTTKAVTPAAASRKRKSIEPKLEPAPADPASTTATKSPATKTPAAKSSASKSATKKTTSASKAKASSTSKASAEIKVDYADDFEDIDSFLPSPAAASPEVVVAAPVAVITEAPAVQAASAEETLAEGKEGDCAKGESKTQKKAVDVLRELVEKKKPDAISVVFPVVVSSPTKAPPASCVEMSPDLKRVFASAFELTVPSPAPSVEPTVVAAEPVRTTAPPVKPATVSPPAPAPVAQSSITDFFKKRPGAPPSKSITPVPVMTAPDRFDENLASCIAAAQAATSVEEIDAVLHELARQKAESELHCASLLGAVVEVDETSPDKRARLA